jgi:metal-responsive CopG/Arc/MetJ family transcriptional regulator
MERVMISMPEAILETVDEAAKGLRENRSQFIRLAVQERLARLQAREFEALLAEGYQVMAEESELLAGEAMQLQSMIAEAWQWE